MMKHKISPETELWDRVFATPGILAMITTVDSAGRVNAAPIATVVRASHNPLHISFITYPKRSHTYQNIKETKQFVVNLVQFERDLLEKVCVVGLQFPAGVNELDKAGLTMLASESVNPPRISECNRHFECELLWAKEWIDRVVIMGNVVATSVDADCIDQDGFIRWETANQALYCGAPYFNQPPYQHQFVGANRTLGVDTPFDGPEIEMYRRTIDALKI